MNKKDLQILVAIWIGGFVLAALTGLFFLKIADHGAPGPAPTDPTTSWVTLPASTLAEKVQVNAAWTVTVIFPFLFAPIFTLLYIIVRFSKAKNPKPADFHEHVPLEVVWTIIPAFVLVAMAVPAYKVLLYLEAHPERADVYVDVTEVQYYWQYHYPNYDVTVTDDGATTDNPLVVPVGKSVMLRGMSNQVNHAWWVPAFGLKFDVIPGRINTGWFRPTKTGLFKDQCAELCGALHAYMWIHVKVVKEKEYYEWLEEKGAVFPPDEIAYIEMVLQKDIDGAGIGQSPTAVALAGVSTTTTVDGASN